MLLMFRRSSPAEFTSDPDWCVHLRRGQPAFTEVSGVARCSVPPRRVGCGATFQPRGRHGSAEALSATRDVTAGPTDPAQEVTTPFPEARQPTGGIIAAFTGTDRRLRHTESVRHFKNSFKFETTVSKIEANDGNERGGEVGVSPNEAPDVSGAAWQAEAKRPPGIEREGSSRAGGTSSSLKGR
jgi:hypothetical protein